MLIKNKKRQGEEGELRSKRGWPGPLRSKRRCPGAQKIPKYKNEIYV